MLTIKGALILRGSKCAFFVGANKLGTPLDAPANCKTPARYERIAGRRVAILHHLMKTWRYKMPLG